jgi:hypothetical protein
VGVQVGGVDGSWKGKEEEKGEEGIVIGRERAGSGAVNF